MTTPNLPRSIATAFPGVSFATKPTFCASVYRGEQGETATTLTSVAIKPLTFWFYVHNGTSELSNNSAGTWASGLGTDEDPFWNDVTDANLERPSGGSQHDCSDLSLPEEAGNSHTMVTASINVRQRADEVVDTVQITCSDETKEISVVYVEEETMLYTRAPPDHGSLSAASP